MLILLEGCDGSGKTTLAAKLQRALPYSTLLHSGPLRQDPFIEYEHRLWAPRYAGPVIADRWHLGELVYGPILRGGSKIDHVARWHIESFLDARGAIQVLVSPPDDVIQHRLTGRGDELITPDMVPTITTSYRDLLPSSRTNTLVFPCDEDCDENHIDEIIVEAWRRHTASAGIQEFPSYVGPLTPDYLIVLPGAGLAPAAVPHEDSASRHLVSHMLVKLNGTGKTFGVVHAVSSLTELWYALGMPWICALGGLARDCIPNRLPAGAAPGLSPSFMKNGFTMVDVIIDAADNEEDMTTWPHA